MERTSATSATTTPTPTNAPSYTPRWAHPETDLNITVVDHFDERIFAFNHSGRKVSQLMGASKRKGGAITRIDLCYWSILASLRALSDRDKHYLRIEAQERQQPVSITVFSDYGHFVKTLEGFNREPDRLKEIVSAYLVEEIAKFQRDLDCVFYGEKVSRGFVPLKATFLWSLRVLNIPHSEASTTIHYGSIDKRITRSLEKATLVTAETAVTA